MTAPIQILYQVGFEYTLYGEISPYYEYFIEKPIFVDLSPINDEAPQHFTRTIYLFWSESFTVPGWDAPSLFARYPEDFLNLIDWESFTNDLEQCFMNQQWSMALYPASIYPEG